MNFSNLISEEIDKKRKAAQGRRKKRSRLSGKGDTVSSKPSDTTEIHQNSRESDKKPSDQKIEQEVEPKVQSSETVESTETTLPNNAKQSGVDEFFESVVESSLNESLSKFDPIEQTLSKQDKLNALEALVRADLKKQRYKEQVEKERAVDPSIVLEEIGDDSKTEKQHTQLRVFLKQLITKWESWIDQLPSDAQVTQRKVIFETKRDSVKLLYKLRSQKLKQDMLISLASICYYLQTKEYLKANESYMKLSIGNVAWPIGVKSVGIHSRSADEKITGENKKLGANIMIDDKTRRWIVAIKRLITFCEKSGTL